MAYSQLVIGSLAIIFVASTFGHSYVTSPQSRSNQKQSESGCRGPACLGPCDVPLASAKTAAVTIARGATVNVQWPRNNHAGGFIRFAWAKTANSDSHASFDAGVEEIHCHEVGGCGPDSASDPNGGDSGAADGSYRPCQTNIKVPSYLTDGTWTLQWAWFGGAFALGDYYSCIDYVISGGVAVTAQSSPVFYGGDYTYPNQNKCKFFNTDRLHQCVNEPCNNPIYPNSQEQSGPAYGVAIASNTSSQQPATTAKASPATTAKASPVTTASVKPATTGAAPLTTSKVVSAATTHKTVSTTSSSKSLTTGSNTASTSTLNCAQLTNVLTSSQISTVITDVDSWSNVFRMVVEVNANQDVSNWMMQVIWPDEATDTEVQDVFNAGELRCSASFPSRHSIIEPVGAWASKIKAGEQMFVEIRAINTNMNTEFIRSNTQIVMYTAN